MFGSLCLSVCTDYLATRLSLKLLSQFSRLFYSGWRLTHKLCPSSFIANTYSCACVYIFTLRPALLDFYSFGSLENALVHDNLVTNSCILISTHCPLRVQRHAKLFENLHIRKMAMCFAIRLILLIFPFAICIAQAVSTWYSQFLRWMESAQALVTYSFQNIPIDSYYCANA